MLFAYRPSRLNDFWMVKDASAVKWATLTAIVFAITLFGYETVSLNGVTGSDFGIFHDMVQRVLKDPATIYFDPRGTVENARSLTGFLYPPPSFFLLLPFGGLPFELGFQVLSWGSVLAVLVSLRLWGRLIADAKVATIPRMQWLAIAGLLLVTGPVLTNRLGQVDAIILLIVSLGVALCWRDLPGWGSALLAFGSWVKIYPALLLLPVVFKHKWRGKALRGFIIGAIGVPVLAAILFPLGVWKTYFLEMLPVMSEHVIVNIYNQSLSAVLTRLSAPMMTQALQTYDSIPTAPWIRAAVPMTGIALLIVPYLCRSRNSSGPVVLLASSSAIIGLIAPLGWGHSYVYVLPLMFLVIAASLSQRSFIQLGIVGIAWFSLLIPAYFQLSFLTKWPLFWHLFYSRYAIATCTILLIGWRLVLQSEECPAFGISEEPNST